MPTSGPAQIRLLGDVAFTMTLQDLQLIDISNPAEPEPLGILATDLSARGLADAGLAVGDGLLHLALASLFPSGPTPGSASFDVRDVDVASLAFGPEGAPARASLPIRLNRDLHEDLLSIFWIPEAGIAIGDTSVCLSGETRDGRRFRGCDPIQPLAGCGHGYELALLVPLWLPLRSALARRGRPTSRAER